jgi:glycosyltransferase involved in cell wall biosynthesis
MESHDGIVIDTLPALRKSLRVAFVTETYPPEVNGVSNTAARFVEGLRGLNHEVQVIRPRQGQADRADADAGKDEVLMRGLPIPRYPGLRMGLPARKALIRLWSRHRPDVVHIVTEGPLGWSALQAALKLELPVSSDFRTNFHAYSRHYGVGWLHKPIVAYLRKFHNRTLMTLVPTASMRAELAANGFRNLHVVSRGVDTQLFNPARRNPVLRASWGAAPDEPVILSVGRLAPEKNLETLVAAYAQIRRTAPAAKLVVVGDGPARETLRARCPDAVFAGMRTGEDLAVHYASCDMFLFPSLTETFGNVTIEAMASGLAVVAFGYAAAAENIVHGTSGLLAPVDDTEGFVRQAAALAADPARIRAYGLRARAATEQLAWARVIGQFETLLLNAADALAGGIDSLTINTLAGRGR